MRVKLILKLIGKDYILPCNYMYELSSCLYKVLNESDAGFTSCLFDFELQGEPELLRLGYDGGFGRLNAQGVGCVEVMEN